MIQGNPLKPSVLIKNWYARELRVMVLAMEKAMVRAVKASPQPRRDTAFTSDAMTEPTREDVIEACRQTNTTPTEAQIKAENYKTGKLNYCGLRLSIENPAGSVRSGKDQDGKEWSQKMRHTYGRVLGTLGFDGDHIDVFINDARPFSDKVFVIRQVNHSDGEFDEEKCMLGFGSAKSAKAAYFKNYEEGWKGFGDIREMSFDEFKTYCRGSIAEDLDIDPASLQAKTEELKVEFERILTRAGRITAVRFLQKQAKHASASFINSIKPMVESQQSSLLLPGQILTTENISFAQEAVKTNVDLIKSIGEQYFDRIEKAVLDSLKTGGNRPRLIKEIQKIGGITERRAKLIAKDQTDKIYNQLAEEAMRNAGITKAKWNHGGRSKEPRSYHKTRWDGRSEPPNGLNGYIYDLNNPPVADLRTGEKAPPGVLINCGCYATPVLDV